MTYNYKSSDSTNIIVKNIAKTKAIYTSLAYVSFITGMIITTSMLIPSFGSILSQVAGVVVGTIAFYIIQREGSKKVEILDKTLLESVTETLHEEALSLSDLNELLDQEDEKNEEPKKYLH